MDELTGGNYSYEYSESDNDRFSYRSRQDEEIDLEIENNTDLPEDHQQYDDYQYEDEDKEGNHDEERREAREDLSIEPRRKSIYELDSYVPPSISEGDAINLTKIPEKIIHHSESMGVSGIARLDLSPLTQKIIGCVIGENVTTEYPWLYVEKELIEDNIDLHDESSDFLAVKEEIEQFPDTKILIGYAPSSSQYGQFYICLTEEGRNTVIQQIEIQRLEQENRARSAIVKTSSQWEDLGSATQVDDAIVKNNRPLFEIEIKSTEKFWKKKVTLISRDVDDQRDGYVKMVPYRDCFENVSKETVHSSIEAAAPLRDNKTQTDTFPLINNWSQYSCEYSAINLPEQKEMLALKDFLERCADDLCNQMVLNSTWDIYRNDYTDLANPMRLIEPTMTIAYNEYKNYYEGRLCMDRIINDLSWHPFWSGVVVCAYADHAKSTTFSGPKDYNEVKKSVGRKDQVLLWSFDDNLSPKLILKSHREVSSVSFCPLDGDLIVGGCTNGQIAIWHIPGKLEQIETTVVETAAQIKQRVAMESLMLWMKQTLDPSILKVTAMSSLQLSQREQITHIEWMPIFNKVDKNGRIINFKENTGREHFLYQFATSSNDGTIAFWDLKLQSASNKPAKLKPSKGNKPVIEKPDVLLQSISPYKQLDRELKPVYILTILYPDSTRRAIVTTMNIYRPRIPKKQISPLPKKENDPSQRRYYGAAIDEIPIYTMTPNIFIGTKEGQCGVIEWEGYSFGTDQVINREVCKWKWITTIHDGPITHAVRSEFIPDLLMTVGGKIVALWKEDYHRPFFWNLSKYRYTSCSWSSFRPSTGILGRSDGSIEIWNFATNSREPTQIQSISGGVICEIRNHELPLNPQCIAFSDFNGALRVFLAPPKTVDFDKDKIHFITFINRTIIGMQKFEAYQEEYSAENVKAIVREKTMAEQENVEQMVGTGKNLVAQVPQSNRRAEKSKKIKAPTDFIGDARAQWASMELKRMQRVILEKKGLRKEDLDKRRAPVLKMLQEEDVKRRKLKKIIQIQDKIFEDMLAVLFPKQYYEQQQRSISLYSAPREKNQPTGEGIETPQESQFSSPDKNIIYDFMEVQAEALASIHQSPHKYAFQWRHTLTEGRARRGFMDVQLLESNKHSRRKRGRINLVDTLQNIVELSSESDRASSWNSEISSNELDEEIKTYRKSTGDE